MSRETQFIRKAGMATSLADTLPTDLTVAVFRRIIILCLVTAGIVVLGSFICIGDLLMKGALFSVPGYTPFELAKDLLMLSVSLGVAWLVHRRMFSNRVLIALGLGFAVFAALWHSIGECYTLITEPYPPVAFFSFNQAWVVFFPAIVPIRSRSTFLIILLAAAMSPLSRAIAQGFGLVELPDDSLGILSILMGFSAIMGMTVSHVVYRLGRSVKAAQEMGSYTLERSLGGGGMGEVWLASHHMLARPAAVKLIKPEVLAGLQPDEIEKLNRRFEHEVQATAALCSPHTVDIYDYGLAEDGTFYYVMELLDGVDMETLIQRYGSIEAPRAVHFLIQACHSLNEAHGQQLIHRDIKPANLFVCRYGEDFDFVKVLDFGLVKRDRAESEADLKLTADGTTTGTPAYMYPEAISGDNPVDHRADIYSLGCVAYWLLTGQLVFTAGTGMAMLVEHATAKPVPPSQRSETEIPEALDKLVLACLEKNPADRPQSADELSERLRAIEFGRSWERESARGWWELHREG